MRVLLTNDDGYHAPGLQALAAALTARGDTVWVVAPRTNRSGTSCSLTLDRPLGVTQHNDTHYAIDGTPADCVHVALTGLANINDFDAVLSGINDGANLGDDAIHSGTLGAATQAHLFGLPALASSLVARGWEHIDVAVAVTLRTLDQLVAQPAPALWNLNVPSVAIAPRTALARVGRRTASQPVQALLSPKGGQLFWLGDGGDTLLDAGTDMALIDQGFATLSPITIDRTDHAALHALASHFSR
jgi:5'-nucleotidase